MKNLVLAITLASLSTTATAAKPEWAGNGKPDAQQRDAAMQMKHEGEQRYGELKEKSARHSEEAEELMEREKEKKEKKEKKMKDGDDDDHSEKAKGMEKQREMKTEQMRNEAGKGSETGQAMREQHSKKWWKFWE